MSDGPKIDAKQLAKDIDRKAVYSLIAYAYSKSNSDNSYSHTKKTMDGNEKELAAMTLYYYPGYCWNGEVIKKIKIPPYSLIHTGYTIS